MKIYSCVAFLFFLACQGKNPQAPLEIPNAPGGETTVNDATSSAFSLPAPNLTAPSLELHIAGDAAFEATFVTSPATVNSGLGPVFNNTSCAACHVGDGRGRPPEPGALFVSMLMRMSQPGMDAHGGPLPVSGFGGQLQTRAIVGAQPEARARVSCYDSLILFQDGDSIFLSVPAYQIDSAYQSLPAGVLWSPRVAPAVFGLGLLEAIDEAEILNRVKAPDTNCDGSMSVSGRANYVHDVLSGQTRLGRFGWKANTPDLLQQSAAAYNNDMGITTWLFPFETCYGQPQGCDSMAPELDSATLAATTFYVRTLGVPARRTIDDPDVQRGEMIFSSIGCTACHAPEFTTGRHPHVAEMSFQTIHPYTDLLVHDMGKSLADNRPDFLATGSEWRTAPLWGVGLFEMVNGHTRFLHDGRARNFAEAIMWHDGEAEMAKNSFWRLAREDRKALVEFLESL